MLGQIEFQFNSREHGARKRSGNQNPRHHAGQNQEEQVIAGVDGGEHQDKNGGEIDDAVARQAVIHLIGEPSQAGSARECRDDGHGHPRRDSEREHRGDSGQQDAAFLSGGGGK